MMLLLQKEEELATDHQATKLTLTMVMVSDATTTNSSKVMARDLSETTTIPTTLATNNLQPTKEDPKLQLLTKEKSTKTIKRT